jgi:dihydrodipicolinate synthase/N-acetylneuraminate lyase
MPSSDARPPVHGVVPPLVSPLAGRDVLDAEALERLVEHVIGGGVHGLFLLGSTGEGPSLSCRLRRELVDRGCRQVARRLPVLVGISDTAFEESVGLACRAADCGADAVVATTPYYFKPGQAELVGYFTQLAAALPLPLYLYNMPGLTGTVIEPGTVRRLMEVPGIVGIKDSSGNLEYFGQLVSMARERPGWGVFMGREELGVHALAMGAHGVVPGGANLLPRLHADAWQAMAARDCDLAEALNRRITEVANAVFTLGCQSGGFIQGLKAALSMVGLCGDLLAPPFPLLPPADRDSLRRRLISLDVLAEDPQPGAGA